MKNSSKSIAATAILTLGLLTGCTSPLGRIELSPTESGAPAPSTPADPAPEFPAPTGPAPVGAAVLHLVDDNRDDPWVPSEKRELMTTVWYPAAAPAAEPAPYLTADESVAFMATEQVDVPGDVLSHVRTHATPDAEPATVPGGHPLVVLSPGFSFPRATLTGLAEELASQGYVVVGVDHTHESWGTSLPDGRFADCVPCAGELDGPKVTSVRAQDISFVVDRFVGPDPVWSGSATIDPNRIAVGGHSIGGSSALQTFLADPRVDAGFDLDGTFFPPLTTDVDRPFLILEAADHPAEDSSIDQTWAHLRGPRERDVVDGTTHSSFTDLAPLADGIGAPLQDIPGDEAMRITRDRTCAFLNRELR